MNHKVIPCKKHHCTNYAMEGKEYCQKCLYGEPIPMRPDDAARKKYEDGIYLARLIGSLHK